MTSTPSAVAPAPSSLIQTKVINHTLLTPQVMELVVEANQSVTIIPGQRALFVLHDEQGDFNRAYSLVDQDTDNDKTMMTFVIKLIPNGRAAKLREAITLGDTLNIKGIYGHLALQATLAPKVFIASSTGIAPLYNMMKHLPDVDKDLYFTVPTHADLFYEEQIKKLKKLTAHLHITREEMEEYNFGRIDVAHFSYPLETEFYVCGNPGIVKDIEAQLRTLGYTKFFNESF